MFFCLCLCLCLLSLSLFSVCTQGVELYMCVYAPNTKDVSNGFEVKKHISHVFCIDKKHLTIRKTKKHTKDKRRSTKDNTIPQQSKSDKLAKKTERKAQQMATIHQTTRDNRGKRPTIQHHDGQDRPEITLHSSKTTHFMKG